MTPKDPRRLAFDVLREITSNDAYANLVLAKKLATAGLEPRDAGFVTELVSGTCRLMGTYDAIIEAAAGRSLSTLQPAVVDLLRLGAHQALSMKVASHAAVAATVDLARATVGQRVTGVVNAVLRKVAAKDLTTWTRLLSRGMDETAALAFRGHHPAWIVNAYADVLPESEVEDALEANNVAPSPTLVVRPGLCEVKELVALGARPTPFSPFGAVAGGAPGHLPPVREGRAGVQDEGSQLVARALSLVDAPEGPWLDVCAGPGGKAALLAGLAREAGQVLVANESSEHRAALVSQALSAYPEGTATVVQSDGRAPTWEPASFARVIADVPCTGLGALRRRPESRWRRRFEDLAQLGDLQRDLLRSSLRSTMPGGVVAYSTCSPHRAETSEIVEAVLKEFPNATPLPTADYFPGVENCALGDYVQLWPHRHNTDAMFLALIRLG